MGQGDPKVTGVLPIALEKATRVITPVVHSIKEYVCVMELHGDVDEDNLTKTIELFKGRIYQRPPVKSSVKRLLRIRRIYSIRMLEKANRHVLLRVECESGTYMRKLCHDIGIILGTGAHMRELRRIRTGPFTESTAITLHELNEAVYMWREKKDEEHLRKIILPIEKAMCHLPIIIVKDSAVSAIAHGADLASTGIAAFSGEIKKNRTVALFTMKGELIGLGRILVKDEKTILKQKVIVAHPTRIIMEPDLYPRKWKKKTVENK